MGGRALSLDALYPDAPQAIDMREPEKIKPVKADNKRSLNMGFWKTTGTILGVGALIGGSVFATEAYRDASVRGIGRSESSAIADAVKASKGLMIFNEDEQRDLDRIKKFCFGFPWEQDAPTCRVWLKHYRGLKAYSDGDLFSDEITVNAYQSLNKPAEQLGNAESPAE